MKNNIIITDIGSTTTKAILLKKIDSSYQFVDYTTAYTTVEKPYEDVKIGILNSIKKHFDDVQIKLPFKHLILPSSLKRRVTGHKTFNKLSVAKQNSPSSLKGCQACPDGVVVKIIW